MKRKVEAPVIVALGANLPTKSAFPADTLRAALATLAQSALSLVAQSSLYTTPCFPAGAGPDYVNAVAILRAPGDMTSQQVLRQLHEIETEFGRARSQRWGMRTLDLDLLAMGDTVLPDAATQTRWRNLAPKDQANLAPDTLILPHPRLQDRAFVLVPLAEIMPDWRHPLTGQTVRAMLAALPAADRASVHRLPDPAPHPAT